MGGFQERWIAGKTVERLEPREKRLQCEAWGYDAGSIGVNDGFNSPQWGTRLVYHEACTIHFTDGSRLVLLAAEDQLSPVILTNYYPAKRGK
tara:strand:+ start:1685 stop:1960 length:276 start_codon:yes stop_codon:yes gene_type:complete